MHLAKLEEDDEQRFDLEAREQVLLGPREKGMAQGVSPTLIHEWEYRRGFVEHVGIPSMWMANHAEKVFRKTPVRELTLRQMPVHPDDLLRCPELARLLAWTSPTAGRGWKPRIARGWPAPTTPPLAGLSGLRLGLSFDGSEGVGVAPLAGGAFGLSELELESNRLSAGDVEELAEVATAVPAARMRRISRLIHIAWASWDPRRAGIWTRRC